jgi:predicted enzyme related to lactoylglutathione lyase
MTLPEGDAAIALDGTNPVLPRGNCIPCIQVEDLPATIATLKSRGVKFTRELTGDEGYRMATLCDPEDNSINLYEYVT